jgi:hypothetical protein
MPLTSQIPPSFSIVPHLFRSYPFFYKHQHSPLSPLFFITLLFSLRALLSTFFTSAFILPIFFFHSPLLILFPPSPFIPFAFPSPFHSSLTSSHLLLFPFHIHFSLSFLSSSLFLLIFVLPFSYNPSHLLRELPFPLFFKLPFSPSHVSTSIFPFRHPVSLVPLLLSIFILFLLSIQSLYLSLYHSSLRFFPAFFLFTFSMFFFFYLTFCPPGLWRY